MKIKFLVLTVFSLVAIDCSSQKKTIDMKMPETSSKTVNSTYPTQKPAMDVVRLLETQNIFLEEHKMNITFKKVTEDSRCPMNVRCIKPGDAKLEIEVMGIATRPKKFLVSTEKNENFFVFNGMKFTLENLYPSLSTEIGMKELQGKYVADIRIEPTRR